MEEARRLKLEPRLAEKLGIDYPGELVDIIVEFYSMTTMDVGNLSMLGMNVTGISNTFPYVYGSATKEQIIQISSMPNVKKIWYSAPTLILEKKIGLPMLGIEPQTIIVTLKDTTEHMRANEANAAGWTGKNVKIAILDTGVRSNHPMLEGKVVEKFQTAEGNIEDGHSHGTWCASCAAGKMVDTPEYGVLVGVAPEGLIINGKVMTDEGQGTDGTIMQGIERAVDLGANVISLSLGGNMDCPETEHPICQMISTYAKQGVLFSIAAGNSGPVNTKPSLPALCGDVVCVGASTVKVDGGDVVAEFSSRGPGCRNRTYPYCVAPGGGGGPTQETEAIVGAIPEGYAAYRGTSMATPHVAGLLAILTQMVLESPLKRRPTIGEIKYALSQSCVDVSSTGKDIDSGFGRVDVVECLSKYRPGINGPNGDGVVMMSIPWLFPVVLISWWAVGKVYEYMKRKGIV